MVAPVLRVQGKLGPREAELSHFSPGAEEDQPFFSPAGERHFGMVTE